ncbi:MAG: hypothetical protein LBI14_06880 [Treponema sp.]|jgi:hypothetical protein|nr:hypothetical protein [Treponema sp.]
MKSSESLDIITPDYSGNILTIQSPFYALLSIYIPVSVMFGVLPSLIFLLELFTPVPQFFWFCSALVSGIVASLYWAAVKKSKADHTEANIRGSILIVIAVYGISSLFRFGIPLTTRFIPSLYNMPCSLIALVIWFPVLSVKRVFEGQEIFVSYTRIYEGEKLRQIMLEHAGIMSETDSAMKKLFTYYRAFFVIPFVLFLICSFAGMTLSTGLAISFVLYFIAGVLIIGFLCFLRREYAFAAEGLVFTSRPKALMAGAIAVLASAFMGFLFSSDKSLLPFELITNLFRRLLAFLEGLFLAPPSEPPPLPEPIFTQPPAQGLPSELTQMMGESKPSPFWDYLKYFVIALVAALFIWFMINPLLRRSKLSMGIKSLPRILLQNLKKWLKSLALGFKYFIRSLREGTGGRKIPNADALRDLEADILAGYSAAKKRDLRHSISLFARLIYWGQEVLRVSWRPSYAPLEYCRVLAITVNETSTDEMQTPETDINPAILRAGELFEKALYSADPLTRKERDEFQILVETITGS